MYLDLTIDARVLAFTAAVSIGAFALLSAIPLPDPRKERLRRRIVLQGDLPSPAAPPSGCYFHPRCRHAVARCRVEAPALREVAPGHFSRCHFAGEMVF